MRLASSSSRPTVAHALAGSTPIGWASSRTRIPLLMGLGAVLGGLSLVVRRRAADGEPWLPETEGPATYGHLRGPAWDLARDLAQDLAQDPAPLDGRSIEPPEPGHGAIVSRGPSARRPRAQALGSVCRAC